MVGVCCQISLPSRTMCFRAGRPSNRFKDQTGGPSNVEKYDVLSRQQQQRISSQPKTAQEIFTSLCQFFRGQIFAEIQKTTAKIDFKHGIYPPFTPEAGRLSNSDVNHMFRVRSPRYPGLTGKPGYRGPLLCLQRG